LCNSSAKSTGHGKSYATANLISFKISKLHDGFLPNSAKVSCSSNSVTIEIEAKRSEWSATFYNTLQKMGFLFPHPRIQISPTKEQILKGCGKIINWNPRFQYRGFHLHTQHPNEWVQGFLMGKKKIAEDYLLWSLRNNQNLVQIKLLQNGEKYWKSLSELVDSAHKMGILIGLDVSFSSLQQRAYRLLDNQMFSTIMASSFGVDDLAYIHQGIEKLEKSFDFDYLSAELGTSEFTHTDPVRTLSWMEAARSHLEKSKRGFFIKGHVSTGQMDPKYGNFNFLPKFAKPGVGIEPHTVMYYGLEDKWTPVYGRKDFVDIKDYISSEAKKRPTWFFPETSYWVAMDMDIPLFLTDYLLVRESDMQVVEKLGVNGVLS